jgi:hypothetical protein
MFSVAHVHQGTAGRFVPATKSIERSRRKDGELNLCRNNEAGRVKKNKTMVKEGL